MKQFKVKKPVMFFRKVARMTGLEPATFAVTGRRSNQLSYIPEWDLT